MATPRPKTPKAPKCNYCHGFGLDADLWGTGYRWAMNKEQAKFSTPRVNCDRCGKGETPHGEAAAEKSRHRLAASKAKQR
jgi:hypothetical protein